MMLINAETLREYLMDYCGTAALNGFTAALLDVGDIESMNSYDLCQTAERLGVDLHRFALSDDTSR